MLPASTTPAAAAVGAYGAPSQPRQRLTRALRPSSLSDDASSDLGSRQPASTSPVWRGRAVELAHRHAWGRQATYSGRTAAGIDVYSVVSQRDGRRHYRVTYQIIGEQHIWRCQCVQAGMQRPCTHVGAAILLAAYRAEREEARLVALQARMRWPMASMSGGAADGRMFYLVARAADRLWETVVVEWDARPGREVALRCSCEQIACAHIGTVTLRREHEQQQRQQRGPVTDGDGAWSWWLRGGEW